MLAGGDVGGMKGMFPASMAAWRADVHEEGVEAGSEIAFG